MPAGGLAEGRKERVILRGAVEPVSGEGPAGLHPEVVVAGDEEFWDGQRPEGLQGPEQPRSPSAHVARQQEEVWLGSLDGLDQVGQKSGVGLGCVDVEVGSKGDGYHGSGGYELSSLYTAAEGHRQGPAAK